MECGKNQEHGLSQVCSRGSAKGGYWGTVRGSAYKNWLAREAFSKVVDKGENQAGNCSASAQTQGCVGNAEVSSRVSSREQNGSKTLRRGELLFCKKFSEDLGYEDESRE